MAALVVLGSGAMPWVAWAQPTPGGPIRTAVPTTVESVAPVPSPDPAAVATESEAEELEPVAVAVLPDVVDAQVSTEAPDPQLVEEFDRQVDQEARRWEFTLRLIEQRERRDVEAYVRSFALDQRKREFTRRLIEQRVAAGVRTPSD